VGHVRTYPEDSGETEDALTYLIRHISWVVGIDKDNKILYYYSHKGAEGLVKDYLISIRGGIENG